MKYRALYRETRPEVFSEILGQDAVVRILRHQIETDTVSHAYLFAGTRGTGKTTTARILAKAVNCLDPDRKNRPCGVCANCRAIAAGNFMDVIEIDAASNNGVDNIRELRESVNYPPAVGRKKVYIIDEVHMLTPGAYNALLKTLEEPPEDVLFILATTNPEMLSQTVKSRCMRLDFRRVPADILAENMRSICEKRGVKISDEALRLLSANADGSVRDSLSILEQCLSAGLPEIGKEDVLDLLGTVSESFFLELTEKVMTRNIAQAFLLLDRAIREGKDVRQLMKDWMAHLRAVLIAKYVPDPEEILNMSEDTIRGLREQSERIEVSELENAIITLAKAINDARYSTQTRTLMEVAIVSIATGMEYGKPPAPLAGGGNFRRNAGSRGSWPDPRGNFPKQSPIGGMPGRERNDSDAGTQGLERTGSSVSVSDHERMGSAAGTKTRERSNSDIGVPEDADAVPAGEAAERSGGDNLSEKGFSGRGEIPADFREPRNGDNGNSEIPMQGTASSGEDAKSEDTEETKEQRTELWNEVFESLEAVSPQLNAMRMSVLSAVGDAEYRVIVSSNIQKQVLERNQDLIDREMSNRLGRPVRMAVRMMDDPESTDDPDPIAEEAEQASELLGIPVRVVNDSKRKQ
ncbi:MAG: DNA polymerase III subunit gamma/tau [Eubacteriales bacterium]|nr:DNA polymerase III subunit gamma/tau [Eubacteriales bacterium]